LYNTQQSGITTNTSENNIHPVQWAFITVTYVHICYEILRKFDIAYSIQEGQINIYKHSQHVI